MTQKLKPFFLIIRTLLYDERSQSILGEDIDLLGIDAKIDHGAVGDDAVVVGVGGIGNPKELLKNPPNQKILNFLTRGEKGNA